MRIFNLPAWASRLFPSAFTPHQEERRFFFMKKYSLMVLVSAARSFTLFLHLIKHCACLIWRLSMKSLFFSFCLFFFSEAKTKGLASSWRIYSRTLGIDYHGFLQNIWNQAHETHLLNLSKMIALTASLDSLVSFEFPVCVLWLYWKTVLQSHFKCFFEVMSSASFSEKSLTGGYKIRLFFS